MAFLDLTLADIGLTVVSLVGDSIPLSYLATNKDLTIISIPMQLININNCGESHIQSPMAQSYQIRWSTVTNRVLDDECWENVYKCKLF